MILCLSIKTHAFSHPRRTAVLTIWVMYSRFEEEGFNFTLALSLTFFNESVESGFMKVVKWATASPLLEGLGRAAPMSPAPSSSTSSSDDGSGDGTAVRCSNARRLGNVNVVTLTVRRGTGKGPSVLRRFPLSSVTFFCLSSMASSSPRFLRSSSLLRIF
uniref:Uncharacterized protein TCIL3000_6_830 n=1 Tax=Trypanosoma congolense (strain IL3000) TaxID=1068625 RepID=G0UN91_TRYCI|nr:unnamed protein product [Trypanosoma congolense IL3000]